MSISSEKELKEKVKISIKYLVNLKDKTGKSEEEVSFPGGTTLSDVAEWLKINYGISLPDPQIMTILNGRGWGQLPGKLSTELKDGDIICLFPPISGG